MVHFVSNYYLWIKAFHLLFVMCWMAGLFYLPRLFVYHADATIPEMKATFELMEARLYKIIIMPSMKMSIILGVFLLFVPGFLMQGYMHLKILCVFLLIVFQFYLNHCRHQLALGTNKKSSRFFRLINEIPSILLIIIIICVIVKPF
jgi:putative membrane protein